MEVDGERLAVEARPRGVHVGVEPRAARAGGGEEPVARLGVGRREVGVGAEHRRVR